MITVPHIGRIPRGIFLALSFVVAVASCADPLPNPTFSYCRLKVSRPGFGRNINFNFEQDDNITDDEKGRFIKQFCVALNSVDDWSQSVWGFVYKKHTLRVLGTVHQSLFEPKILSHLYSRFHSGVGDLFVSGYFRLNGINFNVVVTPEANVSSALSSVKNGQRGTIFFPTAEAFFPPGLASETTAPSGTEETTRRSAAIVHELVHVYFPNFNRFLAEGLAVYVQQKLSRASVHPNCGVDLHTEVKTIFVDGSSLACNTNKFGFGISKDEDPFAINLDKATIYMGFGSDPLGECPGTPEYLVAGSFVQYLIEDRFQDDPNTGLQKFIDLYSLTPFRLGDTGVSSEEEFQELFDRWQGIYGVDLKTLRVQWQESIGAQCAG